MVQSLASINRIAKQFGMADESKYFIQIDQYEADELVVESVHVKDWTLTEADYLLEVNVLTQKYIDSQALLNRKAVFSFYWRGIMIPVVGEVSNVCARHGNDDYNGFLLIIQSPLAALKCSNHNRVFLDKSSLDIAKEVLSEYSDGRFAIQVKSQIPDVKRMSVQYQESDWSYLYRILLQDGIMIHIHQGENEIEVYLFDDVSQLPSTDAPIELPYRTSRGAAVDEEYVSQAYSLHELTPQVIGIAEYQANADRDIYAEATTEQDSSIVEHRWGENVVDNDAAEIFAQRLATAYKIKQETICIESNCRGLRPGMIVSLMGHPERSGEYLVIQCTCKGSQSEALNAGVEVNSKAFTSTVLAVPAGKPYLPLIPQRSTITNAFTSTISAEVDEKGYYQVRLPFDTTSSDGNSSISTRMLQAFGGADHGIHFPLVKGTQVGVGFDNGDPDRPVILGALHNDNTPSVVTSENSFQNLIRTRSQNEFLMDDTPKEERIKLNTADDKNRLQLNAKTDENFVELNTDEGDLKLSAGKNIQVESGSDMNIAVGGNQEVAVSGDYNLLTEEGSIIHQAGTNIQLTATQDIEWVTGEGNVEIQIGGQWAVEAAKGVSTHVVSGDHQVVVESGALSMQASSDITFSAGETFTLTQGTGTIAADTSGNLVMEGGSVEITGDAIAIKGGTVGNN